MFNKILIPVDLEHTQSASRAIKLALDEAEISNAQIFVMTVAPGFGMPLVASFFDEETVNKAMDEVSRHLRKFVAESIPEKFHPKTIVTQGNPAEQVLKQARINDIDLIVISSHDTEFEQVFLGSCSAKVVRHAKCTVFVAKDKKY